MNSTCDVALFVSHASSDATLAKALVEMFEKATKLSARQIRCTSVAGYRLPVGADTEEQLRREIFSCRVFIGVLTPNSVRSPYVLFELGARWGAKSHLAPVLGRGADASVLSGPLSGLNALNLSDRNQVLQVVQDVAEYLDLSLEPFASFQETVDAVVSAAQSIAEAPSQSRPQQSLDDPQMRVLLLFAEKALRYPTAAQIAHHLDYSTQKVEYCLEVLERKGLVGTKRGPKPWVYWLEHEGRGILYELKLL